MKRYIAILGTMLITTIVVLSGSVVAQWHHAITHHTTWSYDYSYPGLAYYAPDGNHSTVGQNPDKLGRLVLDLGSNQNDWMDTNQDFTVFANSSINESYEVGLIDSGEDWYTPGWTGWDTEDCEFTTPSTGGRWRWIVINATSGLLDDAHPDDDIYGPEVDAVGWH